MSGEGYNTQVDPDICRGKARGFYQRGGSTSTHRGKRIWVRLAQPVMWIYSPKQIYCVFCREDNIPSKIIPTDTTSKMMFAQVLPRKISVPSSTSSHTATAMGINRFLMEGL